MAAKNKFKPKPAPKAPAPRPAAKTQAQTAGMPQPGFWRHHWLPALLLVGLAFGLYAVSIGFGYVLDDEMVIWKNAFVQKGFAGLGDIFASDSFMGYFQNKQQLFLLEGGRYRPLSLATFAMEVGIWGKDHPHTSHFINILLYGLTGVLLYRVLLGLFPVKEGGRWYFSLPFIAAAIFVLHPLHSEAVANIKGRDEILALLGSLGALYATLKYFDTNRSLWLWLSGLFLFLGMLAKENALTFVAVIPFTAWFFKKISIERIVLASVPLLAATFLFIIVRYKALGFMLDHGKAMTDLMNDPFLGMTAGEKYATIFLTLGWYVKLLFVPHPLTHDYYPYHVPKIGWSDWRALASLILYVGMGTWAFLNLRKRNVAAYSIVFWLLTLSIVSNLFVTVGSFMNERFAFMPSVAFCILAAWFIAHKLPEWFKEQPDRPGILAAGLMLSIAVFFGWRTFTRVPDWESKLSLNTAAVRVSPNSARAQCFYAVALFEEKYKNLKDPFQRMAMVDTMDYHLTRALQINPKYSAAWQMVPGIAGARFEVQRDLQKTNNGPGPQMDRLLNDFDKTLENAPNNQAARKYIEDYIAYLAQGGGNPNKVMTFCYRQGYERYFKQLKDPQTAIRFMEAGLKTQWMDERLFRGLAEAYQYVGDTGKAAEMLQKAEAAKDLPSQ